PRAGPASGAAAVRGAPGRRKARERRWGGHTTRPTGVPAVRLLRGRDGEGDRTGVADAFMVLGRVLDLVEGDRVAVLQFEGVPFGPGERLRLVDAGAGGDGQPGLAVGHPGQRELQVAGAVLRPLGEPQGALLPARGRRGVDGAAGGGTGRVQGWLLVSATAARGAEGQQEGAADGGRQRAAAVRSVGHRSSSLPGAAVHGGRLFGLVRLHGVQLLAELLHGQRRVLPTPGVVQRHLAVLDLLHDVGVVADQAVAAFQLIVGVLLVAGRRGADRDALVQHRGEELLGLQHAGDLAAVVAGDRLHRVAGPAALDLPEAALLLVLG